MSHLREIMQRLSSRQPLSTPPGPVGAAPIEPMFTAELARCTDAMLQYEWALLARHLEDLELCRSNATMMEAAGGAPHLELLIAQARAYQQQLQDLFASRGLVPSLEPHSVAPADHAWELRHPALLAQWGIDPR